MKALIALSVLALAPLHAAEKPATEKTPAIVTVGGQVRAPGPVEFKKKLSLYEAIQAARGANEFGSMKRVKLLRDGKATVYDMSDDKQKLVTLEPGDIVEVPQKNFFGR
jgi:protein involved in polysaccharide export with SLBB domain